MMSLEPPKKLKHQRIVPAIMPAVHNWVSDLPSILWPECIWSYLPLADYVALPDVCRLWYKLAWENLRGAFHLHYASIRQNTKICSKVLHEATEACWNSEPRAHRLNGLPCKAVHQVDVLHCVCCGVIRPYPLIGYNQRNQPNMRVWFTFPCARRMCRALVEHMIWVSRTDPSCSWDEPIESYLTKDRYTVLMWAQEHPSVCRIENHEAQIDIECGKHVAIQIAPHLIPEIMEARKTNQRGKASKIDDDITEVASGSSTQVPVLQIRCSWYQGPADHHADPRECKVQYYVDQDNADSNHPNDWCWKCEFVDLHAALRVARTKEPDELTMPPTDDQWDSVFLYDVLTPEQLTNMDIDLDYFDFPAFFPLHELEQRLSVPNLLTVRIKLQHELYQDGDNERIEPCYCNRAPDPLKHLFGPTGLVTIH